MKCEICCNYLPKMSVLKAIRSSYFKYFFTHLLLLCLVFKRTTKVEADVIHLKALPRDAAGQGQDRRLLPPRPAAHCSAAPGSAGLRRPPRRSASARPGPGPCPGSCSGSSSCPGSGSARRRQRPGPGPCPGPGPGPAPGPCPGRGRAPGRCPGPAGGEELRLQVVFRRSSRP